MYYLGRYIFFWLTTRQVMAIDRIKSFFLRYFPLAGNTPDAGRISADELKSLFDEGATPLVIDLRSLGEYARGHIPGSLSIHTLDDLPQSGEVVIYCQGGVLSKKVRADFNSEDRLCVDLIGGVEAWIRTGGEVT